MVCTVRFFSLQNAVCFIILTFGSCIIHILYTGCAKIKKNNSGAKRLNAELNPICPLLALLGAHHILHVSRIRVNTVCNNA